jgi:AraC-like DNA-binding protein
MTSVDTLSDVLRAVRLSGAVYFDVSAAPPWVAEAPPAETIAGTVLPGAQHVIEYHAVVTGECWATLLHPTPEPLALAAGDVVMFPHGDAHVMSSGPGMRATLDPASFERPKDVPLPIPWNVGEPERVTDRLICGFIGCDARPFNPLLDALPRMLRVRDAGPTQSGMLGQLIQLALAEARARRPGSESVLAKLSELLFVEGVRRHLDSLPDDRKGWLAGLRDPQIGRVLGRLHARPADRWTLDGLARAGGMSRSALAQRFTDFVGLPPMQYLAQWRLQMAASMLADGATNVAAVAAEVGYESEAAFSRAFKKLVGMPPAAWRRTRTGT